MPRMIMLRAGLAALVAVSLGAAVASAQSEGAEPLSIGHGRLTIAGSASISVSSNDDVPGWFNYTDYEHNTLRTLRLALLFSAKAGRHLSLLGEIRTENWDQLRPYALYVRIRPWTARSFDIQAGRIPPVFGAFARRAYETDNPLIGYPLAYQYLTSLRSDALPQNVNDLVRMRGEGWQPSYPIGNGTPSEGLPIFNGFRWDTGVEMRAGGAPFTVSGSVTVGTIGDPRFRDNNDGLQYAGRLGYTASPGLKVGLSAAAGPYLDRSLASAVPTGAEVDDFRQRAVGFDAEFSRGYWLIRAEGIWNSWGMPGSPTSGLPSRLKAASAYVEGKYKIRPGLYVAARVDRLGFSDIFASSGLLSWDAPVSRFEVGGGYSIRRNLVGKLVYQHNRRAFVGKDETLDIAAAQLQFWF